MRRLLATTSILASVATLAHAQSLQTGEIGGMPYYLLPASGGCSAATPCSVVTYLGVQSESAGAIANDVQNYFGGRVGPHTIVIAPQENGTQDSTNNWGGYNTATTPEQAQMVAVVQGVESQMGNTVNPAASVVTGGSLGGTGTQAALIAYGPKGQVQPSVFSAGVSFDAADYNAANDPSQIAALCGVPLTAVHGTNDTNQNISFDQNLASQINGNASCNNSFTLVPIQGAGHGTWSGPSGYQAGTGPGTPLATIAADLGSAPASTVQTAAQPSAAPTGASATTTATAPPAAIPAKAATAPASGQITPGNGSLTDAQGHVWKITASGSITEDGKYTPGGGGTSALTIGADGTVFGQDNGHDGNTVNSGGWFTLSSNGQSWGKSAPPTTQVTDALPSTVSAATTAAPTPTKAAAPAVNDYVGACTTGVPNSPASSGGFGTINGQIYTPDGKPFIARGINLRSTELSDIPAMLAALPGLNFVRLNVRNLDDPASLAPAINELTSQGIVVELEDHPNGGGGQGDIGALQGPDVAWMGQVAAAFKNNPYVWYGTYNEPPTNGSLTDWQVAEYNAIRGAGATAPIMIEPGGSRSNNLTAPLNLSAYTSMTNIIADPHLYNYQTNYSTDTATNAANVTAMIAAAKSIVSAEGPVPVLIGEFGDSTTGDARDPGGMQNVQAVLNSGVGFAAWSWVAGGGADVIQSGGQLTDYGQAVAAGIKSGAGASPVCAVSAIPTASSAETAPPLAQASTAQTAPALAPAAAATTAPPLPANSLSVSQVAAMAAEGN